jgi:hypothetical protein
LSFLHGHWIHPSSSIVLLSLVRVQLPLQVGGAFIPIVALHNLKLLLYSLESVIGIYGFYIVQKGQRLGHLEFSKHSWRGGLKFFSQFSGGSIRLSQCYELACVLHRKLLHPTLSTTLRKSVLYLDPVHLVGHLSLVFLTLCMPMFCVKSPIILFLCCMRKATRCFGYH